MNSTITEKKYAILKNCYYAMRSRCYNPKMSNYKWYGERGIRVCDEWMKNKDSFINWAVSNGWSEGLEIDREYNGGDYTPDNCRWVTKKINLRNTSSNLHINVDGCSRLLIEVAEEKQIHRQLLVNLINQGYTGDEAVAYLTSKKAGKPTETKHQAKTRMLSELRKIINESYVFFDPMESRKNFALS